MQIRGLIGVVALCVLAVAGAARADITDLTFDPNPVSFTNGLIIGQITLVEVQQGLPTGGTVLEGTVSSGHATFTYRLEMLTGSVRRMGVGLLDEVGSGVLSSGAGTIGGGAVDVSMFNPISGPTERVFQFASGVGLGMGETSDEFFASYATDGKQLGAAGTVNFMITPGTGLGSTFSIEVPLVPGPAAPAVLGAAALLVGYRRRRR